MGAVRKPRRHVVDRGGRSCAMRMVEMAEQAGQTTPSADGSPPAAGAHRPAPGAHCARRRRRCGPRCRRARRRCSASSAVMPSSDWLMTASMSSAGERKRRDAAVDRMCGHCRPIAAVACGRRSASSSLKAKRKWPSPRASDRIVVAQVRQVAVAASRPRGRCGRHGRPTGSASRTGGGKAGSVAIVWRARMSVSR